MKGRQIFLWFATIGVVAITTILVISAAHDSLYYQYPSEALSHLERFRDGTRLMLAGEVVEGTLVRSANVSTFEVADADASIPVELSGAAPPLFEEGTTVLLSGFFMDGVFIADEAVTRHDETYRVPPTGNP